MSGIFAFVFARDFLLQSFWSFWAASLLSEGRSLNEAALALAVFFLMNAALEVPTGIFADRYGRKLSTLLGVVLVSVGYGLNGVSGGSALNVAAFALTGFGFTLMSGASTAWLLGVARRRVSSGPFHQEKFFLEVEITGRIATVVSAFAAVPLLAINPQAMWWGFAAVGVFAFLFGLVLVEVQESNAVPRKDLVGSITFATLKMPVVGAILASSVFFGAEAAIRNVIYQPYVMDLKSGSLVYLAYFQTTLALARFAGGLVYKYRLIYLKRGVELCVLSLLAFAGAELVAAHATSYLTFVVFYGAAVFMLGWYFPVRDSFLNQNIPDSVRATVLSVDSMVNKLASAVGCLVLWMVVDRASVTGFWNYGAGFLGLSAMFFGLAWGAGK